MQGKMYRPKDEGKAEFMSKVQGSHKTFSNPSYFNTVFISGDDMEKEMLADR